MISYLEALRLHAANLHICRPSDDVDSPLQLACAHNICSNVQMLLGAGGDPNLLNSVRSVQLTKKRKNA